MTPVSVAVVGAIITWAAAIVLLGAGWCAWRGGRALVRLVRRLRKAFLFRKMAVELWLDLRRSATMRRMWLDDAEITTLWSAIRLKKIKDDRPRVSEFSTAPRRQRWLR